MQLQNELLPPSAPRLSVLAMTMQIYQSEGAAAFYTGLPVAMLRQAVYGGLCFASYPAVRDAFSGGNAPSDAPFCARVGAGALSGAAASALANPTDVVKVRLQADGRLQMMGMHARYKGTLDAFASIGRKEGLAAFWRGTVPNVQRAAVVNGCGIAAYDQSKQTAKFLLGGGGSDGDSLSARFVAALVGGCVTAFVGCPFDVLKTRLMNEMHAADKAAPQGAARYSGGWWGALMAILRTEGVFALWKGLLPVYCRQAPFNMLNYMIMEQLTFLMLGKSNY
jgi:hypothetical protein